MANKIYATRNPDITPREIDHMALSRSLAGECVVLLENDGTLPLEGKGKLAPFGNGARQTIRGGAEKTSGKPPRRGTAPPQAMHTA